MSNEGILHFGIFLWRTPNPVNFSSIILKLIGGDPEIQSHIKANVNALIKTIFETKNSWNRFVPAAIKILNNWALTLMKNGSQIALKIQKVYDELGINSRNPNGSNYVNISSEIKAYQRMIQIDLNDWSCINNIVNIHIQDTNLSPHLFFKFLNEALATAAKRKTSLETALTDTHLLQKLNVQMNSLSINYDDNTWLNEIIPSFNYQQYISDMNDLNKFQQPKYYLRNNKNYNNNYRPSNPSYKQPITENPYIDSKLRKKQQNKLQKKARTDEIKQWGNELKIKLKPQYANSFKLNEICAYYHRKDSKCKNNDSNENCQFGRMTRSHRCLCQGNHRIYKCKVIWK